VGRLQTDIAASERRAVRPLYRSSSHAGQETCNTAKMLKDVLWKKEGVRRIAMMRKRGRRPFREEIWGTLVISSPLSRVASRGTTSKRSAGAGKRSGSLLHLHPSRSEHCPSLEEGNKIFTISRGPSCALGPGPSRTVSVASWALGQRQIDRRTPDMGQWTMDNVCLKLRNCLLHWAHQLTGPSRQQATAHLHSAKIRAASCSWLRGCAPVRLVSERGEDGKGR
jgi:hypothetical protein